MGPPIDHARPAALRWARIACLAAQQPRGSTPGAAAVNDQQPTPLAGAIPAPAPRVRYPSPMLIPAPPLSSLQQVAQGTPARGARVLLYADLEPVAAPGLMYRDTVSGPFRVFAYATNRASSALGGVVAVQNPGTSAVTVRIERLAYGGPASAGQAFASGVNTVSRYLASTGAPTVTVGPGAIVLLAQTPQASPPGDTWTIMLDATPSGPLVVSVYAAQPGAGLVGTLLPANGSPPHRGTWPGCDVTLGVTVPAGGAWLPYPPQPWYPGVDLGGASAVDGGVRAVNSGAWGFLWTITAAQAQRNAIAYIPDAGQGHFSTLVAALGGQVVQGIPGAADTYTGQAAVLGTTSAARLVTTPDGGSYYPGALLWLPAPGLSGWQAAALAGAILAVSAGVALVVRGR